VVSPESLFSPPQTFSVMKTFDPQSPGPSVCLVVTQETPESIEQEPDAPAHAAEGDIQMEQ
jgi:hypothetical protein